MEFSRPRESVPLKFGITIDEIDTTLNNDYNTFPFRILRRAHFRRGVLELLHGCTKPVEFYEALGRKRDEKLAELHEVFRDLGYETLGRQSVFDPDPDRRKAMHATKLFTHHCYDDLVKYFLVYLREVESEALERVRRGEGFASPSGNYHPPPARVYKHGGLDSPVETVRSTSPTPSPAVPGFANSVEHLEPSSTNPMESTEPKISTKLAKIKKSTGSTDPTKFKMPTKSKERPNAPQVREARRSRRQAQKVKHRNQAAKNGA